MSIRDNYTYGKWIKESVRDISIPLRPSSLQHLQTTTATSLKDATDNPREPATKVRIYTASSP